MRSRLCVRQLKAEGFRNELFAGAPDTFFIKYLLAKAASCKEFGVPVVNISVACMHARTDEDIYVKVPSDIRSSNFWRLKAALNGTRKASKHWQEYSSDKLVTNIFLQQNDINPFFLKLRICVDEFGWHVQLDQRYVRSLLDAMAMNHGKSMATLRSKGQESNGSTAKLEQKEHTEFRSCARI